MTKFNRNEIEKIIDENSRSSDEFRCRVITEEHYFHVIDQLCKLQSGSLDEKEVKRIIKDAWDNRKFGCWNVEEIINEDVITQISHLKDKKIELLKSKIKKMDKMYIDLHTLNSDVLSENEQLKSDIEKLKANIKKWKIANCLLLKQNGSYVSPQSIKLFVHEYNEFKIDEGKRGDIIKEEDVERFFDNLPNAEDN